MLRDLRGKCWGMFEGCPMYADGCSSDAKGCPRDSEESAERCCGICSLILSPRKWALQTFPRDMPTLLKKESIFIIPFRFTYLPRKPCSGDIYEVCMRDCLGGRWGRGRGGGGVCNRNWTDPSSGKLGGAEAVNYGWYLTDTMQFVDVINVCL